MSTVMVFTRTQRPEHRHVRRGDERSLLRRDRILLSAEDVVFGQLRGALWRYGEESLALHVNRPAPVDRDEDGVNGDKQGVCEQLFAGTLALRFLANGKERRPLQRIAEHKPAGQKDRGAGLDGAHRWRLVLGSGPDDQDLASVSSREATLALPELWVLVHRKFQQQSCLLADELPARETSESFGCGTSCPSLPAEAWAPGFATTLTATASKSKPAHRIVRMTYLLSGAAQSPAAQAQLAISDVGKGTHCRSTSNRSSGGRVRSAGAVSGLSQATPLRAFPPVTLPPKRCPYGQSSVVTLDQSGRAEEHS